MMMCHLNQNQVNLLKYFYPKNTRVEIIKIDDSYTQLKPGDQGSVKCVDDIGQIHVNWDNKESLALIYGHDEFITINK
ncbi:DUF4314 domain-containing protein [Staphylococcus epidermidis]|nr:DUF4314 domain-containing protein [Staphylococcus epidermidis]MBM6209902.1 DUF4314 domain-containing protein [Staphylococcus epidermidis]MBM6212251.1 DUF4314 domain-containing protein [Staphylococcus epidermidis]MBM6219209.1 DUF4314 domain-containing protein [Staphylococcus epidermidis]MBM6223808.1 DUF4314 domain-containing protein [Staphylococcus epidermidis]